MGIVNCKKECLFAVQGSLIQELLRILETVSVTAGSEVKMMGLGK